jgi:hypothetical protein
MWLHYLADTLLAAKELPGASADERRALRDFRRRCLAYGSASEAIWDALFEGEWAVVGGGEEEEEAEAEESL